MSNTGKAILLSALVFPGAGHFYLKKKITGTVLAVSAFFGLYSIVSKILGLAQQIADKIVSGQVQPDMAIITELLTTQLAGAETQSLNMATTVLIIAWVIGIVDSYRVGRIEDKIQGS
ncbi:MAG TPA: hypothetical protein ENI64_07560 [Gammaproteobacteria bacterium]|nr:hypothetical protein [Gammaproteobacteria bacterium]